jgi:type I restriction enzyme M protein
LNIPRYVNTFEEAESIDMNAVADRIQAIDNKMKDIDSVLAGFCQELSIKTPF